MGHGRGRPWYTWTMYAGTALLSVFLAAHALAAPPVAVSSAGATDNAAIMARINAADPSLTQSPTSIAELVEVAELAERKLVAATDADDVGELLTHVGTAREIAYERTGAADHLCKLLAAAGDVLARTGLPADLRAEAAAFTDAAGKTLKERHAGHTCTPATRSAAPTVVPTPIVAPRPVRSPAERAPLRKFPPITVAGGLLLGTATALTLGLVGVRVHRGRAADELAGIRAEVDAASGKTVAQGERLAELKTVDTWTRGATIGLTVSAAVLAAVGVGLVAAGARRYRTERAQLAPFGGPQGAGIVLLGRF